MTVVPAVPLYGLGPEVQLDADVIDLPGFLALAQRMGAQALGGSTGTTTSACNPQPATSHRPNTNRCSTLNPAPRGGWSQQLKWSTGGRPKSPQNPGRFNLWWTRWPSGRRTVGCAQTWTLASGLIRSHDGRADEASITSLPTQLALAVPVD